MYFSKNDIETIGILKGSEETVYSLTLQSNESKVHSAAIKITGTVAMINNLLREANSGWEIGYKDGNLTLMNRDKDDK